MPSPRLPLVLLFAAALATACSIEPPYERTSPFDPKTSLELFVDGPDSAHALGAFIQLSLRAEPALPSFPIYVRWIGHDLPWRPPGSGSSIPEMIQVVNPVDPGSFTVIRATPRYEQITFAAHLDEVVVVRKIWIGQRITTLALSCSAWTQPQDPCDDAPFAVGTPVSLHTRMFDANGSPATIELEFAMMRASVTTRDPSVVAPAALTADQNGIIRLTTIGAGATWVIVRVDDATDSVRVAVAP